MVYVVRNKDGGLFHAHSDQSGGWVFAGDFLSAATGRMTNRPPRSLTVVFTSEAEAEAFAMGHTGPGKPFDAAPAEARDDLGAKVYQTWLANGAWECQMIDTPADAY